MTRTTLSDQQVAKNFTEASRIAEKGPVIITKKGKPSHVLLTYDAYKQLVSGDTSIARLFYYPGAADVELETSSTQIAGQVNKID